MRFYLVAMIFIIFDIEVIFLFPWAVVYSQLGRFGLIEIIVFAAAVFFSFIYLVVERCARLGPDQAGAPSASSSGPRPRPCGRSLRRRRRALPTEHAGRPRRAEIGSAAGSTGGEAA